RRINILLEQLRQQRCLVVLDNFETVLGAEQAGSYAPGYEGYGRLLQRVGEGRHQSCLLLTSREKPRELVILEGETAPTRALPLASLTLDDSRALLQGKGLSATESHWAALHARYSGNPLALKI